MKKNSHLLGVLAAALLVQNAMAQTPASVPDAYASSDKDTRPYDKHDHSGLCSRNTQQFKLPPCTECREHGPVPRYEYHGNLPTITPEGQKQFERHKPQRGFDLEG